MEEMRKLSILNLCEILRVYLPSISAPTGNEKDETAIQMWDNMLDLEMKYYIQALKTVFDNQELETNQKIKRELRESPCSTLKRIGKTLYDHEQKMNMANKLVLNDDVILLREGDFYFMNYIKYNEFGKRHMENAVNENGEIIYLDIPKYYRDESPMKQYHSKKELMRISRIMNYRQVFNEMVERNTSAIKFQKQKEEIKNKGVTNVRDIREYYSKFQEQR